MSKIARFAVLVTALMSLFAVFSSAAGAVTWHNSGDTNFHATGGPGTLSIGANNLACGGSTAIGDAPVGSFANSYSVRGTVTFSPCTLAGQATTVGCNYTLTALTQAGSVTTGVADVTCVARLTAGGTGLCHISGSTGGTYTNPTATTTPGKLTLLASSSLVVSNSQVACPLGTGSGNLTEQTLTVTHRGPILTRTA